MDNIDLIFAKLRKGVDLKEKNKYFDKEIMNSENKTNIGQFSYAEIFEKLKSGKLQISNLTLAFEKRCFFQNIFSILFPSNVLQLIKEEEDYVYAINNQYDLTFSIKLFEQQNKTDLEALNVYYKQQMSLSEQKTIFDTSGTITAADKKTEVLFMAVIHPMPVNEIFNFFSIFKTSRKSILITLSGVKLDYNIWKYIMQAMLQTIEVEGEM